MSTESWTKPIEIEITMNSFRIGSRGTQGGNVDLPVMRRHHFKEMNIADNVKWICSNLSSTFRGTLRRACHRVLRSHNLLSSYEDTEISLFGKSHMNQGDANPKGSGKLIITINQDGIDPKQGIIVKRYGIRIDPRFQSIEHQALFQYEIVERVGNGITINFTITPIIGLTGNEAAVLFMSLNFLKGSSFGGFRSTGNGLINDVKIKPDEFFNFALMNSRELLKGGE
ncbi:MAG: hypothetical protein ACTSRA_11645 [Promethearchaeota archaeon]